MILTPHFTLEELTVTQQRGLDNSPPPWAVTNLRITAEGLERAREILERPIIVTSGYRSKEVNAAVGGAERSAHLLGLAADFICPGFGSPAKVCRALEGRADFAFDQLIFEWTWVHVSFEPRLRREVLTLDRATRKYLRGIIE
jgi:hypothetical protein